MLAYLGRHKACPYRFGGKGRQDVPAYLGRHKACPYWSAEEERDGGVGRRTWAGTRPAPTGPLGGRAGTRPAPTGPLGGGQAQGLPLLDLWGEGRHKACPYRCVGGEREGGVCRRTWAGTRPAPTGALGEKGKAACAGVLGQAQGLPLQVRWGRKGRHKACPYRTFGGEGRHKACPYRCVGGRAGTRPAPTGPLGGRAGTRPAPTGPLGKKGMARWAGVLGQAQGLPYRCVGGRGGKGKEMCQRGRGRAQGMSLAPKTGPQTKVHHGAIH